MKEKYLKEVMEKGNIVYKTDSTIEELQKANLESMINIATEEKGSGFQKFTSSLISIMETDPIGSYHATMLKNISEENKILIRQNEIIIRLLSKQQPP